MTKKFEPVYQNALTFLGGALTKQPSPLAQWVALQT